MLEPIAFVARRDATPKTSCTTLGRFEDPHCGGCSSVCHGHGSGSLAAFKHTMVSNRTPSDEAVIAYGKELSSWVETQVDTRLKQVLSGFFDAELSNARHEARNALGIAARCESELEVQVVDQGRLAVVLEGLADEVRALKTFAATSRAGLEQALTGYRSAVHSEDLEIRLRALQPQQQLLDDFAQLSSRCYRHETLIRDLMRQREADLARCCRHEALIAELRHCRESDARTASDATGWTNAEATIARMSAAIDAQGLDASDMKATIGRIDLAIGEFRQKMELEKAERARGVGTLTDLSMRLSNHERKVEELQEWHLNKVEELRSFHENKVNEISTLHNTKHVEEFEQLLTRVVESRGAIEPPQSGLEHRINAQLSCLKQEMGSLFESQKLASSRIASFEHNLQVRSRESRHQYEECQLQLNENALAEMRQGLENKLLFTEATSRLREDLECRLSTLVSESLERQANSRVASEFRAVLEPREALVRDELASQTSLLEEMRAHVSASLSSLAGQAQVVEARLEGGLAALQRRLTAELRAEALAAMKTEKSAVTALDEQLWLTDQRLGQRIDELAQLQIRGSLMGDHRPLVNYESSEPRSAWPFGRTLSQSSFAPSAPDIAPSVVGSRSPTKA